MRRTWGVVGGGLCLLSAGGLAQTGSIEGVVIGSDALGNVFPLAGAEVSLFDEHLQFVAGATSEEDGSFRIEEVPSREYYILAMGEGFDGVTDVVGVPDGGVAHEFFDLPPLVDCIVCPFQDLAGDLGLGSYIASAGDGHGPGAVFTDLNNDLYPDLYLIRSGQPNLLYVNEDDGTGHRRFRVPAGIAGAGDPGTGTGAIAGDYDNDGDTDLFVVNFNGRNTLLQNQLAQTGTLWFEDVTDQTDPTPGVEDDQLGVGWAVFDGVVLDNSLTAAWADPDRDGDLDLYVGNHDGYFGNPGEREVPGQRDIFYRNNGDGTFSDVTMELGVTGYETQDGAYETPNQWFSSTNAVIFADFNNDTFSDLLVTNKVGGPDDRDMLYLNLGFDQHGHWQGFAQVTYLLDPTFGDQSGAAMGVDAGDIDNDGDIDIYITDFSILPGLPGFNDLWINLLSETGELGFLHSDALGGAFSWGVQMQDLDNDGYLDVHVATDSLYRDFLYSHAEGEIARQAGLAQRRNARTSVAGDFNLDGWSDLFVVNLDGGNSSLFANLSGLLGSEHRALILRLVGGPGTIPLPTSRESIGTRVYVVADLDASGDIGQGEVMLREVRSGSSNAASTASMNLEFGLGLADDAQITIVWASGRVESFVVEGNQFLLIPDCIADMTTSSNPFDEGFGVPNGVADGDDFFFYLDAFAAGDPRADLTGATQADDPGFGIPNGVIDADDFFFYLDRFNTGCSLD